MILKTFGALIVTISSTLLARNFYEKTSLREAELTQIKVIFEKIKNNIFKNNSVVESINTALACSEFYTKDNFETFCKTLENKQCYDCSQVWESSKKSKFPLKDEDFKIIDSFFRQSFDVPTYNIVEKTDEVIEELRIKIKTLSDEKDKFKKMYTKTGICFGMMIVILLI